MQGLLEDYGFREKFDVIKEWYDGYCFGDANIYCPWDVIKYTKKLLAAPQAEPEAFWINTSGNDLVKRFIDKAHVRRYLDRCQSRRGALYTGRKRQGE